MQDGRERERERERDGLGLRGGGEGVFRPLLRRGEEFYFYFLLLYAGLLSYENFHLYTYIHSIEMTE